MNKREGPNDGIPNKGKPETLDWKLLEKDTNFQKHLLTRLQIMLLEKKFGREIYEEFDSLNIRAQLEDSTGQVKIPKTEAELIEAVVKAERNPIIPEIVEFRNKVTNMGTINEIMALADREGLKFTSEEIEQARNDALIVMSESKDLDK